MFGSVYIMPTYTCTRVQIFSLLFVKLNNILLTYKTFSTRICRSSWKPFRKQVMNFCILCLRSSNSSVEVDKIFIKSSSKKMCIEMYDCIIFMLYYVQCYNCLNVRRNIFAHQNFIRLVCCQDFKCQTKVYCISEWHNTPPSNSI